MLSEVELGFYLSFFWCIGGELGVFWGFFWSLDLMVCRLLSGVIRGLFFVVGFLFIRRVEIIRVDWLKMGNLK